MTSYFCINEPETLFRLIYLLSWHQTNKYILKPVLWYICSIRNETTMTLSLVCAKSSLLIFCDIPVNAWYLHQSCFFEKAIWQICNWLLKGKGELLNCNLRSQFRLWLGMHYFHILIFEGFWYFARTCFTATDEWK